MSLKFKKKTELHELYLYRQTNIFTRSNARVLESLNIENINSIGRKKLKISEEFPDPKDMDVEDEDEKNEEEVEEEEDVEKEKGEEENDDESDGENKKSIVKRKRHCQVEAKCRTKRIDLYKKLQNVIKSIEEKLDHPIPIFKIIDDRRKVNRSNGNYTQEQILRKIYASILINEKFIKNNNKITNLHTTNISIVNEKTEDHQRENYSQENIENDKEKFSPSDIELGLLPTKKTQQKTIKTFTMVKEKNKEFGLKNLLLACVMEQNN
ncbi:hypothetical protein RB653_008294 [Dictyostelium firmibasis]|uniref:Uncharacterized protein n=1 Tax=Dictyostelium firmibasis TaxID=79012 RepID=A0AAN7TYQ2_9MYCE